jgi:arabinose-5-phosphate isomerase
MLAIGDALALVTSRMRNFGREDFARFHPAGSLGRKLSKVKRHMRPLRECRVAGDRQTVREVLVAVGVPGRRTGATMLTDAEGRLSGVFTDSDLARLFEQRRDGDLDRPIAEVMTADPVSVRQGSMMTDAVTVMAGRKISELPVVDDQRRPVGLIDVTDLVGLLPRDALSDDEAPPHPVQFPASATLPCRVFREPPMGEAS